MGFRVQGDAGLKQLQSQSLRVEVYYRGLNDYHYPFKVDLKQPIP